MNTEHKMPVKLKAVYGNVVIQAPDGQQLCRTDDKRGDWYANHAEDIAYEIECDGPDRIVRLRFEPAGRDGVDDSFLQSVKKNQCVVCGSVKDMTRHHVVPWAYRRNMPQKVTKRCFHDIVLLCMQCHGEYETTVDSYKLVLCEKYDVPFKIIHPKKDGPLRYAVSAAHAIVRDGDKIPKDRLDALRKRVVAHAGSCDDATLMRLTTENSRHKTKGEPPGKLLADKIEDYQEFFEGWRQHFLENTKPKFMPDHWSVHRKVKGT